MAGLPEVTIEMTADTAGMEQRLQSLIDRLAEMQALMDDLPDGIAVEIETGVLGNPQMTQRTPARIRLASPIDKSDD